MSENPENSSFWIKAILYIIGSAIGLGAKLANMRRQRQLTWTDGIIEIVIATAAAFFVWSFCHYIIKRDDVAIVSSVIAGRYGDDILIAAYHKIERMVNKWNEK